MSGVTGVQHSRRQLARWGISVNAPNPNYIKNPDYFPRELLANQEAMTKMQKNIPLGRLGERRKWLN